MDLSIIIPGYNVELYITKCLECFVNLSGFSYEIIVINDGSKDSTIDIIREFEKRFTGNITVIDKENGGLSDARNAGIKVAKGTYVTFIDSDDYIFADKFSQLVKELLSDQVDIGYGSYIKEFDGKLLEDKSSTLKHDIFKGSSEIMSPIEFADKAFNKLTNDFNSEACISFFKREFLQKNDLLFYKGIYHEDTLLYFESLVKASTVRFYDYCYYVYVQRSTSIMNDPKKETKRLNDKLFIASELLKIKNENNINSLIYDSIIVNLYFYTVIRNKIKDIYDFSTIKNCKKLTIKSKIMKVFISLLK